MIRRLLNTPENQAVALMVLSALTVPMIGVFVRMASEELDNGMVVFLRNALGLLLVMPFFIRHRFEKIRSSKKRAHALRGLLSAIAIAMYFLTLAHMPLANATVLQFTAPMFLPLAAWPLLKEKPGPGAMVLLLAAFAGAWLVSEPERNAFGVMTAIGLGSAAIGAVTMAYGRRMTDTESPMTLMFYFALYTTLATTIWMVLFGQWQMPSMRSMAALGAGGFLGNMAQVWVMRAYTSLPSTEIAALKYLSIPVTVCVAWVLYEELPGWGGWAGIALILGTNFLTVIKSRAGKRAKPPVAEPASR